MINLGGLHTKRRLQSKWWRKCPSIEALIGFFGGIFPWSIVNYEKHDNHDNPIIYQLFMIIMIIHKRDRRWNTFENEDFSILSFGVSSPALVGKRWEKLPAKLWCSLPQFYSEVGCHPIWVWITFFVLFLQLYIHIMYIPMSMYTYIPMCIRR